MRVLWAGVIAAVVMTGCGRDGGAEEAARRAVDALVRGDGDAYLTLRAAATPERVNGRPTLTLADGERVSFPGSLTACAGVAAEYDAREMPNTPNSRIVVVRFASPCIEVMGKLVRSDRLELGLERRGDGTWRLDTVAYGAGTPTPSR